jgi:hypothetical protein
MNQEDLDMIDELKAKIKVNPNYPISKKVVYGRHLDSYKIRKGLTEKERVGDIVKPATNMDQIIDMVTRHYKKINQERKGRREAQEM